ncbi:hypothetical protein CACET_c27230 [Clostridium aceticum]|uniref:Uncharacterized protein n=1 Tax=Clostridium aceticum TaxID=84022 RepID=A0A0D8I965_9CLOT|nr:hypothetical protein [Clostridium aceticum]AKL96168.1 hypothetical protein CACET_c27230 [Clostridium aceticum]KJF26589.1 hypothetical protein TZ02_11985 [Clostridium aceticum]
MKLLCTECLNIFESDFRTKRSQYRGSSECPSTKCSGILLEVDELYLVSIKALIAKGYPVADCCSGHIWQKESHSYIRFYIDEGFNDLFIMPEGYVKQLDMHKGVTYLRISKKYHKNLKEMELQKQLFENALSVQDWAKNLKALDS